MPEPTEAKDFSLHQDGLSSPSKYQMEVTAAESPFAFTKKPRAIYIGVAGTLSFKDHAGTEFKDINVPQGILPFSVSELTVGEGEGPASQVLALW